MTLLLILGCIWLAASSGVLVWIAAAILACCPRLQSALHRITI